MTSTTRAPSGPWSSVVPFPMGHTKLAAEIRPVRLSLQDRFLIVGQTRTGKTTLLRELIYRLRRFWPITPIQILDSKQAGDFRGWEGAWRRQEIPPAIEDGHLIWQPPDGDDIDLYNDWLEGIYNRRKPVIIVIDELSSLAGDTIGKHPRYPEALRKIQKQGAGLNIMMIIVTQEVAGIPRQVRNQATHIARFRLIDAYDGQEVDRLIQRSIRDGEPADQHGFWYNRTDEPGRVLQYFASYQSFIDLLRAA